MIVEKAPAKINLALHVTGKRTDGYHLLDSLVAFADMGDVLHFREAAETSLTITGPFAHRLNPQDEENLVLRAVAGLRALLPELPAVEITLEKHLPVSSGIGGGSADAAAALRGLLRLGRSCPDREEITRLALSLGADVPVCLESQSCRMQGIGETISPWRFTKAHALLVNPGVACNTSEVFRELALSQGKPGLPVGFTLSECRNDLEAPARRLLPVIGDVLTALRECAGVELARMSGSGATCFALFRDGQAARAAAARLHAAHPQWWVAQSVIG